MGVHSEGLSVTVAAAAGIEAIRELSASIGIPAGLTELNVKEEDLKTMAENAQKDACMLTNPRTATLDQVIDIYKAAMLSYPSRLAGWPLKRATRQVSEYRTSEPTGQLPAVSLHQAGRQDIVTSLMASL